MKRILVADDSPTARALLRLLIRSQSDFQLVGMAGNGEEAVRLAGKLHPDVITMDLNMPVLNGFQAIEQIMETHAVPIVVVSSLVTSTDRAQAIRAMRAGAVAALPRPPGPGHPDAARAAAELIDTIRALSRVKVVHHRLSSSRTIARRGSPVRPDGRPKPVELVVIGASTGGPRALAELLRNLNPGFPAPVLVVQHISPGFIRGLRDWLDSVCPLEVTVPEAGEAVQTGRVYLAPDGYQMGITAVGRINLAPGMPGDLHCPSVDYLFHYARLAFANRVVGVLLTGMGQDGVKELTRLHAAGAMTLVQDEDSSAVWGMPGEAVRQGAATVVATPREIAECLNNLRNPQ